MPKKFEDLTIPKLKKYINYNKIVTQNKLKKIKHKKNLVNLAQKFYKKNINTSVTTIQSCWRNFLNKRNYLDFKAQHKIENKNYINSSTLLGDEIKYLKYPYFYSIGNFAFDIREAQKLDKNPYTNLEFTPEQKKQIQRIVNNLEKNNIPTEIDNSIPLKSLLTSSTASLFSKLSDNQSYPSINIFNNFTLKEIKYFLKFLYKCPIIKLYLKVDNFNYLMDLYYEIFEDNENEINQFKYSVVKFLDSILDSGSNDKDIISLIITESIRSDILEAYYNKDYLNYCNI